MKTSTSTYYAAKGREPSARAVRDEDLKPQVAKVHKDNYGVYGIRKAHVQLDRNAVDAAYRKSPEVLGRTGEIQMSAINRAGQRSRTTKRR